MNAPKTRTRPIFALASLICIALTLAQHYGDEAQLQKAVTVMAQWSV